MRREKKIYNFGIDIYVMPFNSIPFHSGICDNVVMVEYRALTLFS